MPDKELRKKFPSALFLLEDHEKRPFDPRATLPGVGVSIQPLESWYDPETGITVDWEPLQ